MNMANVSLDRQCFLTDRKEALALTFNVHENSIYFSENKTKTISRVKFAAGEGPQIIIGGTGRVEGTDSHTIQVVLKTLFSFPDGIIGLLVYIF